MAFAVLLPDCTLRKVFDVYNCLRRSGYSVILTSSRPTAQYRLLYNQDIFPLRKDSFNHFSDDLRFIAGATAYSQIVFVPTEEDTSLFFLRFVTENQDGPFRYALPDAETFELTRNKATLSRLCTSLDISCPRELRLADLQERFVPALAKPFTGSGGEGHVYLNTPDDLKALDTLDSHYLLQEQLPDPRGVEGAFFLFDRGNLLGYYGHRRLRTYPVRAGVTVYSQISFNEVIKTIGIRLLSELKWHGLAMIEFLFDPRTQQYKVIEVNPRLWGSFLLSEFAHTGFLANYVRLALRQPTKEYSPRHDVAIRWFFPFDLLNYLTLKGRIPDFWHLNRRNTCYIGFTYSTLRRSFLFLFFSLFDPHSIAKLCQKVRT